MQDEVILKQKYPKLILNKIHQDLAGLRILFFSLVIALGAYTACMLAFWYFPPLVSLIPAASYLLAPILVVSLLGRWTGRWLCRKEITPFLEFLGAKEEWVKMVKEKLLGKEWPRPLGDNGFLAQQYAIALTGREATVLGLRIEEVMQGGAVAITLLLCFMLGGEVVRSGREFEWVNVYSAMWSFIFVWAYPTAIVSGKRAEFDERVAELRKGCELSGDEERGENKDSIVELSWLVEQLLTVEEDSADRALERREVIIDPIMTGNMGSNRWMSILTW